MAEIPELSFRWSYEERNDGEIARFVGAGFRATVRDCDGDFSTWNVWRHAGIIGEGEFWGSEPYHFDAALLAAEKAIRDGIAVIKTTAQRRDGPRRSHTSRKQVP